MSIDIKTFDNSSVRVFEVTGRIGSVEYLTSAGIREIISAQQAAAASRN